MVADAKLRYTILLACLVIGPIVILIGLTNRWLWFRPMPDLSQVTVITPPGYNDYGLEMLFGSRDNSVVYINPENMPEDQPEVMINFYPTGHGGHSDPLEIIRRDDEILVYSDWRASARNDDPAWIFAVDEDCIVMEAGERRRYSQGDAALISVESALQVTLTNIGRNEINTGTITEIYLSPSPSAIHGLRAQAIQRIIIGVILTVIGGFYFYGPRRGWLRWREGLTMPDDAPFWDS